MEISLVNRYTWHKNAGDFAAKHFYKSYFKNIGLRFRKIRKDKYKNQKGKFIPDGYIIDKENHKIAVAEIKLIEYKDKESYNGKFHLIKIDETIMSSIKKAKKQLETVGSQLPKVIYLILDDSFATFENVMFSVFGKWKYITRGNQPIFNGYSGLCNKYRQNNKMRDNLISAVICYKPMHGGYKIFIIRNKDSILLPKSLLDKRHLCELWDYKNKQLKRNL